MVFDKSQPFPKSFEIMGHTIKIRKVKKIPNLKNCVGAWLMNKKLIYILNQNNIDNEWHTLIHEIMHCTLDYLNYDKLSENEKFVDTVAGCLHQTFKTIK